MSAAGSDKVQLIVYEEYVKKMKTRVIMTLCVVFVLGVVSRASAQATLVAGSPEDKAFTACMNEQNVEPKINCLLDFKKQFPNSHAMSDVLNMLIDAYRSKGDNAKVNEVGEEAIKLDPDNFTALMAVSRNYAMERDKKNVDRAVTYATRAVEVIAKKKAEPRYNDDGAWKSYVDSIEKAAQQNLNYAKAMKP
jgi:tetratricopeptide (TPR) repeat protein